MEYYNADAFNHSVAVFAPILLVMVGAYTILKASSHRSPAERWLWIMAGAFLLIIGVSLFVAALIAIPVEYA